MNRACTLVLLLGFLTAQDTVGRAAPAQPINPLATTQPIPRDVLAGMYKRELGDLYRPELLPKLYEAHQLLERFFASTSPEDHKAVTKLLEGTGLDVNVVGRLARIRMHWPATQPGVYHVKEQVGPHVAWYFIGLPKGYDYTKPWPLVIMLPTASEFIKEPPPDGQQVVQIYSNWMLDELRRHGDAVVIMPLLNLGELYGPSQPGMNTVIQPLLHVARHVNIDPTRVYITGHDMSGHAVWNLSLLYTTYFAALNPLAGGAKFDWQRVRLMNLKNNLVVPWADADDKVVPPAETRELVMILKRFKYNVDYTETQKIGHAPSQAIVEDSYKKLVGFTRELYPKEIALQSNRPETMFNRIDWLQVYQPDKPGDVKRARFQLGSGFMLLEENSHSVKAARTAPNRFELQTDNVALMRLYFNEQIVDFAKPVTIVINRKVKFEGLLKPSMEEMLADQLFLGRGWRYFAAVLDIDMFDRPTSGPVTRPTSRPKGVIEVGPMPGSEDKPKRIEIP